MLLCREIRSVIPTTYSRFDLLVQPEKQRRSMFEGRGSESDPVRVFLYPCADPLSFQELTFGWDNFGKKPWGLFSDFYCILSPAEIEIFDISLPR